MVAPGGGAGNTAAAVAQLKAVVPMLYKILAALPVGSEDWKSVSDMVRAAGKIVGNTEKDSLVPSAIQQMALAAKGGPLKSAPPVALQTATPGGESEQEPI